MTIAAEHVRVSRQSRTVLSDVSVGLAPGECLSVVGPNGAGKTTLLLALAGLLPLDAGRITLDGRDLSTLSRRRIAQRIACVLQNYEGFLGFRVRDVLESARFAHLHPLERPGPADAEVIRAEIEACELGAIIDRRLSTLSAGERQKVWLAGAFVQRADYLFFDEPAAALDPKYLATLIRLLRDRCARGAGILVVCHDLNMAAALGGRVLALNRGRVVFEGPVERFLDPAALQRVYESEFHLTATPDGRTRLVYPRV